MNEILKRQILSDSLFHAYIFEGQKDEVRQMYADFTQGIFKDFDHRDKELGLDRFYDLEIIRPDNNIIAIDRIREMKKKVFELPLEADKKLFVIEDADMMRAEAQNALLKTLEEAPEYCIIVLTTDNRNKLYDTILSRCQVISAYTEAKSSLEEEEKEELYDLIFKAYSKEYYSVISCKTFVEKFQDQRKKELINESIRFLHDILLVKLSQNTGLSNRYIRRLQAFDRLNLNKIEALIFKLENINELIRVNINFQLAFEDFLFDLMEE